ncbi:MAG TPA: tRNA (adenosine(37)-N6)-dimethylallyltransferase MiaA [Candidatus Saccharimonadales bacterium]|nr:tRNA (adenosine(37)-N6)-dimethylallyltransferase MiaA [Candidatus Saccharimonadales bacterium]
MKDDHFLASAPQPLVVIVGPTASGKTALAIELAEQYGGEIICADSRTIYKEMDIGTAKPTPDERARVPHWGLDLVAPNERYTAADFKQYANQKIDEIRRRGHVPFLVGGTGLYVDAVIFDYQFSSKANDKLRAKLNALSIEQLHGYCAKHNIILPENKNNKRYVIRAIEQNNQPTTRKSAPISASIIVGIATERDVLRTRISARTEQLFEDGVVEEATILGEKYGWNSEAMTGNIYPLVHAYLENRLTLAEVKEKYTTVDWRLAKRQLTWLRRNPYIQWYGLTEAKQFLSRHLAIE